MARRTAGDGDGGESRTTARVRRFVAELRPLNVLVCNAYAHPAPRKTQIPNRRAAGEIGRAIFDALYSTCTPHTIVVHGAEAVALAQDTFGVELDVSSPLDAQTVTVPATETRVYAFPHFSGMGAPRGFAVGRMDAVLADLAARIRTPR